jgi:uncharacterized protein (UPF0332 family)
MLLKAEQITMCLTILYVSLFIQFKVVILSKELEPIWLMCSMLLPQDLIKLGMCKE